MLRNLKKIVAVVGCQRSGTTLTGQILGAHPNAVMIDEPEGLYQWFDASAQGAPDSRKLLRKSLRMANKKYKTAYRRLEKKPEGGFAMAPGVTHLVLKAPNLTYSFDELLRLDLPVVAVFLVRDPRAVVASLGGLQRIPMVENQVSIINTYPGLMSEYADEVGQMASPETSQTVKRALFWRVKSGLVRKFEDRGIPTLLVRYEDLVADPEGVCKNISDHIGLPFDPLMLAHETVFRGYGPGMTKRTRAVDSASLQSWRNRLSSEQEKVVLDVAGAELGYFGYDSAPSATADTDRPAIDEAVLRAPIILAGRGGSGTRLLSEAAADGNVFLGNELNASADSLEWVGPIYEIAIGSLGRTYLPGDTPPDFGEDWERYLVGTARDILGKGKWDGQQPWGWKLPESLLALEDLFKAFPQARFVHLVRHPVTSALRRSHMTSREDNPIGKAVLRAAYVAAGLDPAQRHDHETYFHNAVTWRFQVGNAVRFARENLSDEQYLLLKYEDFCTRPRETKAELLNFLGVSDRNPAHAEIDENRTGDIAPGDPRIAEVWEFCKEVATEIGYSPMDG